MNNPIRNGWLVPGEDARLSYVPGRTEAGSDGAREGARDRALSGLAGSSVADRFRAWTGRSGRRYVFSVFPVGGGSGDLDRLPLADDAVAMGVQRSGSGTRTVLWVAGIGVCPAAFLGGDRVRALRALGRCELHLHLLAAGRDERQAVIDDLAVTR